MPTQSRGSKLATHYANFFKTGFNAFEFVIDFGRHYSESEDAELCARIIVSPGYIKELQAILRESIEQYEQSFGAIKTEEE
ncbi:MAG: DUF3467 domain-containing protein [Desulfatitalea sp.]